MPCRLHGIDARPVGTGRRGSSRTASADLKAMVLFPAADVTRGTRQGTKRPTTSSPAPKASTGVASARYLRVGTRNSNQTGGVPAPVPARRLSRRRNDRLQGEWRHAGIVCLLRRVQRPPRVPCHRAVRGARAREGLMWSGVCVATPSLPLGTPRSPAPRRRSYPFALADNRGASVSDRLPDAKEVAEFSARSRTHVLIG